MAYDPNDPKDKKIVADAVAAALAEAQEAHEAEIEGLVANRDRLKAQLAKARKGDGEGDNGAEVERLETALATATKDLAKANKELAKANKDLETVSVERDTYNKDLTTTLTDNSLNGMLSELNIGKNFMSAAKALLAPKVQIETVDGERRALIGGKALGDFAKEWSQSDEAKAMMGAPANSGGGALQNGTPAGTKAVTRTQYESMAPAERASHFAGGGTLVDG